MEDVKWSICVHCERRRGTERRQEERHKDRERHSAAEDQLNVRNEHIWRPAFSSSSFTDDFCFCISWIMCPLRSNSQEKKLRELTETLLSVCYLLITDFWIVIVKILHLGGREILQIFADSGSLPPAFASQSGWNLEPKAVVAPDLSPTLGI